MQSTFCPSDYPLKTLWVMVISAVPDPRHPTSPAQKQAFPSNLKVANGQKNLLSPLHSTVMPQTEISRENPQILRPIHSAHVTSSRCLAPRFSLRQLSPSLPVSSMSDSGLDDFLSSLKKAAGTDSSSDADTATQPLKKRRQSPAVEDAAHQLGYADINKLEHCTRTLQKSIRQIIEEAPNVEALNKLIQDPSLSAFTRQEMRGNSLLHLLSKLKTLHDSDQLPIFDEIIGNTIEVDGDRKRVDMSKLSKVDSQALDGETEFSNPDLPTLPKIKDPALRNRVFQHKSTSANKTYLDEQEIVLTHNERLEFLGDSVLNTLVTIILYDKFPYANEGFLSQTRSLLVNNKTLAEFSTAYGFDQALRCNVDEVSLRSGKQKVYADVFEAYLGALAMERGYNLAEIETWLRQLMRHKIDEATIEMKKLSPINKDAKTELYSLVGTASFHPTYQVVENGNGVNVPYKVHCLMGDDVLGEGVAPGLKDAGLRAAMEALKNRPLLEKYGRQRLETDRSLSVIKPQNGDDASESSLFPLLAGKSTFANKFAKNELYAYFGKQLGLTPEYIVVADPENKRYKVELKVNERIIAVAYDVSKKNAMSRAAAVVLENKNMMDEILNWIG